MKNNSQPNPAEQSREDRFKRIASNRTNDIMDRIRILGNCSNKSTYEYSEAAISKIFRAIDNELRETKKKFTSTKTKFTL